MHARRFSGERCGIRALVLDRGRRSGRANLTRPILQGKLSHLGDEPVPHGGRIHALGCSHTLASLVVPSVPRMIQHVPQQPYNHSAVQARKQYNMFSPGCFRFELRQESSRSAFETRENCCPSESHQNCTLCAGLTVATVPHTHIKTDLRWTHRKEDHSFVYGSVVWNFVGV